MMTNHILEIFDIFRKISPLPDEIICKIIYTNNCIVHPIAKQLKKEYNCIKDAMFFKNANKYYNIITQLNNIGNDIVNNYDYDNNYIINNDIINNINNNYNYNI